MEVDLEGDLEGDFRGDFKQDLEGDLLSSSVRSGPGLVQYRLKFNSFELDSEVGPLVSDDIIDKSKVQSQPSPISLK